MRLGIHLIPNDWDSFRARVRYADQAGFGFIWVAESHMTVYDIYIAMLVAAENTNRITIGPGCTNAVIRHESVVASSLASIDTLAGGRVVVGIGSGDTPVMMLGKRPARLTELRQQVNHIRKLTAGEPVQYDGRDVQISWAKHQLPIYVFAEGPKTLELAGEIGDGVLAGNGIAPNVIEWVHERISTGARQSNRSLEDLDVWHACMCAFGQTKEEAMNIMRARVANRARHNFLAAPDLVPSDKKGEVTRLIEGFDLSRWYDPKHASLVTDFMVERFAVTGTPDQVIGQLKQLEDLGVKSLMLDLPMDRFDETLHLLGDKVIPAIS